MKIYKGYLLNFYTRCEKYPTYDNRYQVFKPRPYDDAEYYLAYSYDKEHWIIAYKGKVVSRGFIGTFEEVVEFIEKKNMDINPKFAHS